MARSRNSSVLLPAAICLALAGGVCWWSLGGGGQGGPQGPDAAIGPSVARSQKPRGADPPQVEAPPRGVPPGNEGPAVTAVAAREPVVPLKKPAPRPDDYVGSQACATCHAAITATYQDHSMGQSMALVDGGRAIETDPSDSEFHRDSSPPPATATIRDREREYTVERREHGEGGSTVWHHERVVDAAGIPIYDQSMPVRFAVGSGTRGRSYLIDHDGQLFQSPIGWYSSTGRFDLSPGHDRGLRFERNIGDGCLYCHAGRVEHDPDRPGHYSRQVFAEASIGCERCHGPGAKHVARMTDWPAGLPCPDTEIVNPTALEPRRREAVCNQCHLGGEAAIPRFGRGFYDFRPGDLLDDTLLVFVHDETIRAANGEKPVSQVEQMRQSRCYQGSDGAMGCVSCHDPHSKPGRLELDDFYRSKCNACHAEQPGESSQPVGHPCSLSAREREAAPANGSCIRCHMPAQSLREVPHTAMTDHRVPRLPSGIGQPGTVSPTASSPGDLVAFDDAATRVPRRELDRARGMALAVQPGAMRSTQGRQQAVTMIVPRGLDPGDSRGVVAALDGDADALRALADLYAAGGRMDAAVACWQGVLESDPADEATLSALARQYQRSGRMREALGLVDRLAATNPSIAAVHAQRAAILAAQGHSDDAVTAALHCLQLDPSRQQFRSWFADLLERIGRGEEAASQRQVLSRLEAAAADSGPSSKR